MLSLMFEASAVIKLRLFSKGDVWSVIISFFLACNFIKKRLWHWCFPVNFAKFLRAPVLQNTSRRLLLNLQKIPFIMELIIMKNINKTPRKIENVNDNGNT